MLAIMHGTEEISTKAVDFIWEHLTTGGLHINDRLNRIALYFMFRAADLAEIDF